MMKLKYAGSITIFGRQRLSLLILISVVKRFKINMCYISVHLPHSIFEVGMTNLPTIIKNKIHQHVYELDAQTRIVK